jgi:two-component system sensor histidine kinase HydH
MTHQIDNVMDFVNTKSLRLEMMSLKRILLSTIEKLDFTDEIKINLPENDIVIMCDFNAIEVVFENLLLNAKQAVKGPGVINVRLIEEDNFVKIEVEDTGKGIPDDVLPKIFDPLFTTKQEGTGLGLPSCRNIVEQHGGTIEVKTQVDKGTTFTVKLPITKFETQPLTSNQIEDQVPKVRKSNWAK